MSRPATAVLAALLAIGGTVGGTVAAPAASHAADGRVAVTGHAASKLLVTRLKGIHSATQVISVTTPHYGSVHATVQAFAKTASGWHRVAGPWSAWIARNGFAHPGKKREGDGKVPTGSYHFSFFFGVDANPGVRYPWRHAGPHDYWDDDPSSPRYNTWVNTRHLAGSDPEPMDAPPSYDDVAVIAYNTARTPGRGSAIFLHVTHHSPTSGCVALPRPHVIQLLRWLNPADHPRIIMGRTATVTR
ncbi:MAG TPA: L,D-transpeptidase family protein [Mycobacteriales bacterium]|jgi:L,D-peptidoglycan transpeptidase YkuD (ErfK/YbiS/YcfS/YnhG family)|nr:L,D-transpeptidase family protein [Mycobacteriales bacterium]